ncbi:MAG TPA: tetratricopeptide repeat protein, partial [Planctomycetia bacterium]|nr:tetratricopeptide repeat protein [Planctomycetia bacterium]
AFREALAIVEPLAAANADPRFRIGVAKIRNNLGDLLRQLGRHDEAESELNRSVQIREGLVAESPERLNYRHDLAKSWLNLGAARADRRMPADAEKAFRNAIAALDSKPEAETNDRESWSAERWLTLSRAHNNLGMLQRAAGRNAEAEASFKSALDVKEKLADAFPSMPQHRRELANAVNSLGVLQGDVGRGRDAEASFERAVRIYERLAAEFPAQASHLVDMAGSCKNLGQQIGDDGRLEESLVWLTKGIDALEPVVRRDPAFVKARSSSCLSHWARATSLCGLMRYQEGVRDWSRAIELDDGRYRDSLRLKRASANLNLNDRARVAEDAGAVAGSPAATAEDLLVAAALLAQCATIAAADVRAAEGSAAGALSALRKAKAKGLEGPKQIMEGSAFNSLKARPDFQKFIKDWEAEASPPKRGDMPP